MYMYIFLQMQYQSFVSRKIQIQPLNENAENVVPVFMMVKDNCIKKTSLIAILGEGLLTCKRDNEVFHLDSDEQYVYIDPDVDTYYYKVKGLVLF